MDELKKDEYVLKPCIGCNGSAKIVDVERIKMKLDSLYDNKDFDEAERLINYWLSEVTSKNDKRTELELQNEYIGFLRKQNRKNDAIMHAKRCSDLITELSLDKTVSGSTILLNVATVYKAFGEADIAMTYFRKAEKVYSTNLKSDDKLFAGLYNNMALALVDLGQFAAAKKLYNDAIAIMLKHKDGFLDAAISYLNFADLYYKEYTVDPSGNYEKYCEFIEKCCTYAWELLDRNDIVHDAYYRFVAEKTAPVFGFYGYFLYEKELRKRANAHENI